MANTHTLKVVAMDCYVDYDGLKDSIQNVHWIYEVSDGTNSTTTIGVETLDVPNPNSFTAFDQLDEATVSGWVLDKWGEERVAEMKANLDAQLDKLVNPIIVTKSFAVAPPEEVAPETEIV